MIITVAWRDKVNEYEGVDHWYLKADSSILVLISPDATILLQGWLSVEIVEPTEPEFDLVR